MTTRHLAFEALQAIAQPPPAVVAAQSLPGTTHGLLAPSQDLAALDAAAQQGSRLAPAPAPYAGVPYNQVSQCCPPSLEHLRFHSSRHAVT